MNFDPSSLTPDEFESRITALVLGELPPDEAEAVRHAIEVDPELAKLHAQIEATLGFVREAVVESGVEGAALPLAPKLSDGRRAAVLSRLKQAPVKEFPGADRRRMPWAIPMGIAASLLALLGVSELMPETRLASVDFDGITSEKGAAVKQFGEWSERGWDQTSHPARSVSPALGTTLSSPVDSMSRTGDQPASPPPPPAPLSAGENRPEPPEAAFRSAVSPLAAVAPAVPPSPATDPAPASEVPKLTGADAEFGAIESKSHFGRALQRENLGLAKDSAPQPATQGADASRLAAAKPAAGVPLDASGTTWAVDNGRAAAPSEPAGGRVGSLALDNASEGGNPLSFQVPSARTGGQLSGAERYWAFTPGAAGGAGGFGGGASGLGPQGGFGGGIPAGSDPGLASKPTELSDRYSFDTLASGVVANGPKQSPVPAEAAQAQVISPSTGQSLGFEAEDKLAVAEFRKLAEAETETLRQRNRGGLAATGDKSEPRSKSVQLNMADGALYKERTGRLEVEGLVEEKLERRSGVDQRGERGLALERKADAPAKGKVLSLGAARDELRESLDGVADAKKSSTLARRTLAAPAAATLKPAADAVPAARPIAPPIPQPEVRSDENAFSTFSLNVTDVSFKLAAASLEKGVLPEPASIRTEEFINAMRYRDPEPAAGAPVAFAHDRATYPFAHNRELLRFAVRTAAQGREAAKPLNLVLLVDNSGSMERADRVRILREAVAVLARQLQPQDQISVVTFARTPRLWVDGVPGNQAGELAARIGTLTPEGGTNLEDAMKLAYDTASRHFQAGGVNRVVLLTDGAANLGEVDPTSLQRSVEAWRQRGVALDCFGIGWEGLDDDMLETLARHGDGRYGFLNSPADAETGFASQLAGALRVAAADVKVQVEFNPQRVEVWRQVGYARHQLTKEQFRDNTVDAAELGAAESGNALYVVETKPAGSGPIATVRVRYRDPASGTYREHAWPVPYTGAATALDRAPARIRLAASAAAFSEWLAGNPYAAEVTPDRLLGLMQGIPESFQPDPAPQRLEWMIRQAKSVSGK